MLDLINGIDAAILLFIQENVWCGFLNSVMLFFSRIGNAGAVWLITAAALLLSKKYRRHGMILLACVAICWAFTELVLKNIIDRPRPFLVIEGLKTLSGRPKSFAFPSGHACAAFAAAYAITHCFRKKSGLIYIVAALIAIARVYVGVHYPSDVVVGALIGTLGSIGICFAVDRYRLRRIKQKRS